VIYHITHQHIPDSGCIAIFVFLKIYLPKFLIFLFLQNSKLLHGISRVMS